MKKRTKKIYKLFFKYLHAVAAIALCCTTLSLSAQSSMKGKDFWVTFGQNFIYTSAEDVNLELKMVSETATTVTLSFTGAPGQNTTVSLAANVVTAVPLNDTQKKAIYNSVLAGGTRSNHSLHITALDPIIVYTGNFHTASSDATALFPVPVLGTNYYHAGYRPTVPMSGNSAAERDGFLIVAPEGGTSIYLNDASTPAITLNAAGEVFRYYGNTGANTPIQSSVAGLDLTGMHITANKPVAYFSATRGTGVPVTYRFGDVLYEQLFPVEKWGMRFYVPSTIQSKMRIRVIAACNGTNLFIPDIVINNSPTGAVLKAQTGIMGPIVMEPANPTSVTDPISGPRSTGSQASLTGLQAGQFVEIDVGSAANGCYISSNLPVMVVVYMVCSGSSGENGYLGHAYNAIVDQGDPSIGWVPPMEQYTRNVRISRFAPSNNTNLNSHYAQIVTPTATKLSTTVINNGNTTTLSDPSQWKDNNGLSYCSYLLTNDNTYTIDNSKGVVVGGYGSGKVETYYYLAGSACRTLSPTLMVNGEYYDFMDSAIYANCDSLTFECLSIMCSTVITGDIDSVVWKLNGVEQTDYRDTLLWKTRLPNGDYTLEARIKMNTGKTYVLTTNFTIAGCPTITYEPNDGGIFGRGIMDTKLTECYTILGINEGIVHFSNPNFIFVEWNTEPNGSGISYTPGDCYDGNHDLVLYAIWRRECNTKPIKIEHRGKKTTNAH